MRKFKVKLALLTMGAMCFAQTNPLYELPNKKAVTTQASSPAQEFLLGTDSGLYRLNSSSKMEPLWTKGKVTQIIRTESKSESGEVQSRWYFSSASGILTSSNLIDFRECNNGLPFLTIKQYENKQKSLVQKVTLLKDLCVDPLYPNFMVTATKDNVYLSRDGGDSWTSIGSTSQYTAGIKAVAVAHMPKFDKSGAAAGEQLVVFMSHSIYGFSYCYPDNYKDASLIKWNDVISGFAQMPTLKQVDEVSDIIPVLCQDAEGNYSVEIYCAQTYLPNIYKFDWRNKKAVKIYRDPVQLETIDGLCQVEDKLLFTSVGQVSSISLVDGKQISLDSSYSSWKRKLLSSPYSVNAAHIPPSETGYNQPLQLSELWLLKPNNSLSKYHDRATDKKALYASVYQLQNMNGITKYKNLVKKYNLNSLVIDMKDDYGLLRFKPNSSLLKEKGYVTQYKVDVEKLVEEMKQDNIYLVARIVVFKDKHLSEYAGGKYAVWNYNTKRPWIGTKGTEEVKDEEGNVTGYRTYYYDENWVDPYSEEVWEYNVEIAKELIDRGFDEVQFDYIRFPTDGKNLSSASYRWKDKGMDKESALVSFLSYVRKNIDAPVGVDIYGANGWYRSSTRTGQDVELMSDYVDVICPMFYPSHFEQSFLEYKPLEERPYRIYFYGTYRNTVMGRNRIIVRPWVQAFYMGVRYDRVYYDKNYVRREIFGVRDSVDRGYMYWNNSGRNYEDVSPDPADDVKSPWRANESDLQIRLPAFSTDDYSSDEISLDIENISPGTSSLRSENLLSSKNMVKILDDILAMEVEEKSKFGLNFLLVKLGLV